MGKSIVHLADGEDFGAQHFGSEHMRDFGFSGSAQGAPAQPKSKEGGRGAKSRYAEGGHLPAMPHVEAHADGSHTVHHSDGRRTVHHAEGGHSIYHSDGKVEHHQGSTHVTHHPDGSVERHQHEPGYAMGGPTMPARPMAPAATAPVMPAQANPVVRAVRGYAEGGHVDPDAAEDKALVRKGVRQHENQEHGGEHADLKLARGGMVPHKRSRRGGMAMNSPATTPERTTTPHNATAGGQIPYGVQPDSNPDISDNDGALTQMSRGGRVKNRH